MSPPAAAAPVLGDPDADIESIGIDDIGIDDIDDDDIDDDDIDDAIELAGVAAPPAADPLLLPHAVKAAQSTTARGAATMRPRRAVIFRSERDMVFSLSWSACPAARPCRSR
jgi:hypothetical protein